MLFCPTMTSFKFARSGLRQTLDSSAVASFLRTSKARWSDAWSRSRALNKDEIQDLENRGNVSPDWKQVRLLRSGSGSLEAVYHCRFEGHVVLNLEKGSPELWRSRMRDVLIGASTLEDVGLAERLIIEDGAVLRSVHKIIGHKNSLFCLGLPIHPGSETKTRRVFLFDGMRLSDCADLASLLPSEQEKLERELVSWLSGIESEHAFVGQGAKIERTSRIENCYVGPGTLIQGASSLQRCILASTEKHPVHVGENAILQDSVLEPGSRIDTAGHAMRSLLLESSSVERAGQVEDSILGPNTHVAKGEVTASLLGPFVGFHHQALLISAVWPEGHGNIGYGANVGSNHTGRKPDQEIRPGEGNFFGLGCSIKFPADFSAAPYSLFATGVITPPQRVVFPFSLITPPLGPVPETATTAKKAHGLNEILPGWMWGENAYALIRNAYKYLDRNRAERHVLPDPPVSENSPLHGSFLSAGLFAPRIANDVIHALLELRHAPKSSAFYGERDLPGLGKNFMRKSRLAASIAAYEDYLRIVLCRALLWDPIAAPLPSEASPIAAALGLSGSKTPGFEPGALFKNLLQSVDASLAKDGKRGREIFHDYGSFHPEPDIEPIRQRLREDLDKILGPLKKRWKHLSAA